MNVSKDPVCGMEVGDQKSAQKQSTFKGDTYSFCSTSCQQKFDEQPERYTAGAPGQSAPRR